jgi:hypothetical protein
MDYEYIISELNVTRNNVERLIRSVEQMRDEGKDRPEGDYALDAPSHVKYDRERFNTSPKVAQPRKEEHPRQDGNGEHLELDVDTLHVADDGERKTFRVRGGAFRKWGVFIWPEVLERDFGIDSDGIKPGLHPFKYRVRILMDGDKPKKVVGIVQ